LPVCWNVELTKLQSKFISSKTYFIVLRRFCYHENCRYYQSSTQCVHVHVAICQSLVHPFHHWGTCCISQMIRDHLMELLFHKSMCRSPWISPLLMRSLTSSVTPDFTSSVEGPGSCSTLLQTSPAPGSAAHLTMAVWDRCLELGSVPHRCVCGCGCGCVGVGVWVCGCVGMWVWVCGIWA